MDDVVRLTAVRNEYTECKGAIGRTFYVASYEKATVEKEVEVATSSKTTSKSKSSKAEKRQPNPKKTGKKKVKVETMLFALKLYRDGGRIDAMKQVDQDDIVFMERELLPPVTFD